MELSEMFLMTWAIVATVSAGFIWSRAKHHLIAHALVAQLLAEVVTGEIKATQDATGLWTVENDDMRMSFKKREK